MLVLSIRLGRAQPNALITSSPVLMQRLTPLIASTHRTSDLIVSVNLRVALINEIDDLSAGVIAWIVSFPLHLGAPATLHVAPAARKQSI